MKAIENIKATISENVTFSINTAKGYPELSCIEEQAERLRTYITDGLGRMTKSQLFTKEEIHEVANYAETLIILRSMYARQTLRELKRDAYKF